MVWRTGGSGVFRKKGIITQLCTQPEPGSITVCIDEMGPDAAKSYPCQQLVKDPDGVYPADRATQEVDIGCCAVKATFGGDQTG